MELIWTFVMNTAMEQRAECKKVASVKEVPGFRIYLKPQERINGFELYQR